MLNFAAISLWIFVNYFFGWISFTPILCLFATFFLMVPALIDFELADFKLLYKHKKEVWINIWLNFILFPIVAIAVSYLFFGNNPITYWLWLMSFISWGWLLMSWLNKTNADRKFGFNIFVLNMLIFTVLFFPIDYYLKKEWLAFMTNPLEFACDSSQITTKISCSATAEGWVSPFSWFVVLVIVPFIITRIIRFFPKFFDLIERYKIKLSKLWTFLIISYIFALQPLHTVWTMSLGFLFKVLIAVILIYIIIFWFNYFIYKKLKQTDIAKALFWVWISRFLTLWLIFSFLYAQYFWASFMLVFAVAYLVQIWWSTMITKFVFSKK